MGVLKPKQYARVSNEVKYKKKKHLYNVEHVVQSNFQKMLITFKAQTLQLILSSLVSEF